MRNGPKPIDFSLKVRKICRSHINYLDYVKWAWAVFDSLKNMTSPKSYPETASLQPLFTQKWFFIILIDTCLDQDSPIGG